METAIIDQAFILGVLRTNKDRLRNEFGIERIGLYGSFARNEQTAKSDIDLIYHLMPSYPGPKKNDSTVSSAESCTVKWIWWMGDS